MRLFIFSLIAAFSLAISAYADPLQEGLQNQAQGQAQGQAQNAEAKAKATGVGIGVGAAFNKGNHLGVQVDASTKVEAEPAPSPHIALTSTGCIGSVSGSGTAPVVGIGLGITRDHDDCFKIEMAKVYYARGMIDKGDMMMESTSFYKEAAEDAAEAKQARRDAFAAKHGATRLSNGETVAWHTERIGGIPAE